jgi:hypothetical protein
MNRSAVAALILLSLPAAARAQAPAPAPYDREPDRRELHQDRRELGQDRRELADDRWDLRWVERLLADHDAARASRNRRALARIEDEISRTLAREVHQARVEVAKSSVEVRRDGDEGRRERRDDRRDLRDDRRDARRIMAIEADFRALRGRMDRRALDRKHALLVELHGLARAELREDRRELREDRRDARDDVHR